MNVQPVLRLRKYTTGQITDAVLLGFTLTSVWGAVILTVIGAFVWR